MKVFDQLDPQTLDRREWELWWLTLAMILVLMAGVALLMYPMVFSRPVPFSVPAMRWIFFGYCVLCILLVVYLINRHGIVRHLRRQLAEEHNRNSSLRQKASADLLDSLPRFDRFQDRLAMDFRRALNSEHPLSLVIARLRPSASCTDPPEVGNALGDAANALIHRLRTDDSLYLFQPGVFGILLPGTNTLEVQQISKRLSEALSDASGATSRFTFDLQAINYPEQAESARELEEIARACVADSEGGGDRQAA